MNTIIHTLDREIKWSLNLFRKFSIVDQYDWMADKERTKTEKNLSKKANSKH